MGGVSEAVYEVAEIPNELWFTVSPMTRQQAGQRSVCRRLGMFAIDSVGSQQHGTVVFPEELLAGLDLNYLAIFTFRVLGVLYHTRT
jgi:hypothetical protein